jgi:hypothetical protein
VCLASQPDPNWDGTYVRMVSPADASSSAFVVIEIWGCHDVRLGGPLEALASGIDSRLVTGTMRDTLQNVASQLIDQPHRAGR